MSLDIKRASTSYLITRLAHPSEALPPPMLMAIAEEIDRRIPVPDPRIGRLCEYHPVMRAARVVSIEPGGALRLREDGWSDAPHDIRAAPDEVKWIDG